MRKVLCKLLCVAVFVAVTVSVSSTLAFAGDVNTGEGTEVNPIEINDVQGLLNVNDDLNASYILKADLDLSTVMDVWKPIASFGEFKGNFNGNGHKISGMNKTVSTPDESFGLFGYIGPGGKVEKLTIDGKVYITNEKAVGSIAGTSKGHILNCYSTVTNWFFDYSSRKTMVGGIVGYNTETGQISNCQCRSTTTDTSDKAKFRFDSFDDPDKARKEFWYVGFMAGVADSHNWEGFLPKYIYAHAGYPDADDYDDNTLENIIECINSGCDFFEFDVHYLPKEKGGDNQFHTGHNGATVDDPEFKNLILLLCGDKRSAYYNDYWESINPKWANHIIATIDNKTRGYSKELYEQMLDLHETYGIPWNKMDNTFCDYNELMNPEYKLGGKRALDVLQELIKDNGFVFTPGLSDITMEQDANKNKEMFQNKNPIFTDRLNKDLGLRGLGDVGICLDYRFLTDNGFEWTWLKAHGIGTMIYTVNDYDIMDKNLNRGLLGIATKDAKSAGLRKRNDKRYNIDDYKVDDNNFPYDDRQANIDFLDYVGYDTAPQ